VKTAVLPTGFARSRTIFKGLSKKVKAGMPPEIDRMKEVPIF
jgi:hypothetical protein